MPCSAVFVFIGAEPSAEWLPAEIARDANGYLLTGTDAVRSGLWPRGDRDPCPLETTLARHTGRRRRPLRVHQTRRIRGGRRLVGGYLRPSSAVDPAIALLMKTGAAWRVDMPRPMPSSFREQIWRPVERAEQPVQYLTARAYTTIVLRASGAALRVMRKYYFGVHWPPHVRQRILSRLIDASLRLRHARPSRATRHCNRRGRSCAFNQHQARVRSRDSDCRFSGCLSS